MSTKSNFLFILLTLSLLTGCSQKSERDDFILSIFQFAKDGNREALDEIIDEQFSNYQSKKDIINELIIGMKERDVLSIKEISKFNDGAIEYYDKKRINGRQLKVVFYIEKRENNYHVVDMNVFRISPLGG